MTSSRLAIIGVGHIAEHQLNALVQTPVWSLVGACDKRAERQALIPEGTPFFTSADELLSAVNADLVLVATPNTTHYDIGRKVLESGKNLLLEKPCCETRAQMRDLAELADRKGLFFSVAMHAMHALDVRWLLENHSRSGLDLSDIIGFELGFFDPLVQDGALAPAAASLGNPWFDSGVNALSVIGSVIPPEHLRVDEARFTRVPVGTCPFPQVSVSFAFADSKREGRGTIETNWALGLNRKTTRLFFGKHRTEVLLDHSNEAVVIFKKGREESRVELRNDRPRLVNHYIGVLTDAHRRLVTREPNLAFAQALHGLLFDAMEFANKR